MILILVEINTTNNYVKVTQQKYFSNLTKVLKLKKGISLTRKINVHLIKVVHPAHFFKSSNSTKSILSDLFKNLKLIFC